MDFLCSPRKVFKELEDFSGKVIHIYGSQEWGDRELQAGLHLWEVKQHLDYSKTHELDAAEVFQIFQDEHRVERMLSIMKCLKVAIKKIHRGLKTQTEIIASKLSKGLSSTPDDILSLIFEFTILLDGGTKQATRLSRVCQRFRRVAFGTCHLWNTLDSDTSKKMLNTLVARSGPTSDLNVMLSLPSSGGLKGICSSMDDIYVPLASRWKTLEILSGSDGAENSEEPSTVDDVMQSIFDRYPQLELPRLQKMHITQCRWDCETGNDSWTSRKFVPTWTTPNLQVLVCNDYIPRPSPVFSSLRSFTSSITLANEQNDARFTDLLAFLKSAKAVTDVDLTFEALVYVPMQPLQLDRIRHKCITSLSLHFTPIILPDGIDDLVRPLMTSLVMPSLETFSVSVKFRYDDLLQDTEETNDVQMLINALLPDHTKHTNLTSLNLELTHTEETRSWGETYVPQKNITIPLHKIPHVSSLNVKTFCILKFEENTHGGHGFDLDHKSALRELRLHDCVDYDKEMLKRTVSSLKKTIWNTLESFKVERCFHQRDYKAVLKRVGEERLSFIPRRRMKFST